MQRSGSDAQELSRDIGLTSAIALVVSNMIGVGVFTTTGFLAGDLGQPSLVIGIWLVGALLAMAGALCYGELAINFPRSGGEYVYLTEAWGRGWGFVNGWVSFFAGFSAPTAAAALACAAYVETLLPASTGTAPSLSLGIATFQFGRPQLIAVSVVVAFSLANFLAIGKVSALQNVLTAIKLVVIGGFLLLGFTIGSGDWQNFSLVTTRTSTDSLAAQFAVSLIFVVYGYSGWNAAVYVAEEIRNPRRTLPLALVIGTSLVAVLYVALNAAYIYANPLSELKGVLAVGAKAATTLFGEQAGGLFSAGMALSLLGTVNAMCIIGPRVYYAMAKDGAFFHFASTLHPRWKSPSLAVTAQGVCCCVLILTGTFEGLARYIGFTLSMFSALSVLALFKFRSRPGWNRTAAVNFLYPLVPLAYVAMNAWIFFYFVRLRGWEAFWALLTVVGGAIAFAVYSRTRRAA